MTSPKGFLRARSAEMAEARLEGSQWIVARSPVPNGLTETDVEGPRDLRGIRIDWPTFAAPSDVIPQLAGAGVPQAARDWGSADQWRGFRPTRILEGS